MNDDSLFERKPVGKTPVTYIAPRKVRAAFVCRPKTERVPVTPKTRELSKAQKRFLAQKIHDEYTGNKLKRMFLD